MNKYITKGVPKLLPKIAYKNNEKNDD